ncbi:hypothetical protein FHL15_006241 [Xylaria flabelliformis]|uniref:Uncharacterized protein n=1 Tax=Xylaria flabelliformis TaxID=2512241 RepID=A0A553HY02_9PEZI|nr:hypothetical protein FHL15_006241 [Xylaria flabelliformis]
MARRDVIVDSEDEDGGDDVFLPHAGGDLDRPEPEPLSPEEQRSSLTAREGHQQLSDVTDFAKIYDTQRDLAVQQSHLIENIVRQSQRASASSGDVSFPSKKTGRRVDPSSGTTDVTSPMILTRPRNHMTLTHDDTSNFTTPRKSMGQVWDIPSSPEDAAAPRSTKSTTSRENLYDKIKRRRSRLVSSPAPAEMSEAEEATPKPPLEDHGADYPQEKSPKMDLPPMLAAKRNKVSHHDATLADTTKFYIAQSNLTTMQKLEYQRINLSVNGYGGLPGSLPNYKSSATTIPYSTPAGCSPVPPLPWEEPPAQPSSPQRNVAINLSSSPDVIGNGFDLANEGSPAAALETETPKSNRNRESPRAQGRTPATKGKKRAARDVEEDELSRDDIWDPNHIDVPQESYKPRPSKRRAARAAGFSDVGNKTDTLEYIPDEALIDTQIPPDLPAPSEPQLEVQPKKRGRKKKQPTTENLVTETDTNEELNTDQNLVEPQKPAEPEPSPEKPKKRRGRPRKSEPSKAIEETTPEAPMADEPPITEPPQKDDGPDSVSRKQANSESNTKRKRSKAKKEVEDTESEDDRPPLGEVDSNLRSPSKSVSAKEETPARGSSEEKSAPKAQAKEKPKSSASQSKPTYRVGLSKRSRIAPLLKIIRK